jgi:hypothetical protein
LVGKSPGEGRYAPELQEAGKGQKGGPLDAGKRAEHPGRRKFNPVTNSSRGFPVGGNVLNREFHAEMAGEKWVYLTVIPDLLTVRSLAGH